MNKQALDLARERSTLYGAHALTDSELLAIVAGSCCTSFKERRLM